MWFSPFPVEVPTADLIGLFRDCADRAEQLRRDGAAVVLVIGCELTLFNPGYLPGTFFYDRIRRLATAGPRQLAAFARLPKRLNAFLAEAAGVVFITSTMMSGETSRFTDDYGTLARC